MLQTSYWTRITREQFDAIMDDSIAVQQFNAIVDKATRPQYLAMRALNEARIACEVAK